MERPIRSSAPVSQRTHRHYEASVCGCLSNGEGYKGKGKLGTLESARNSEGKLVAGSEEGVQPDREGKPALNCSS